MQNIVFDSGIREYKVNDTGVLRFNPSDPNVYKRFFDATEEIKVIEQDLVKRGEALDAEKDAGEAIIRLMAESDRKTKEVLSKMFGGDNDLDKILGGINVMAVANNGERVITNFINALWPVIQEGAELYAKQQINDAVQQAQMNREQRRAQQ